jgi:nitric oxide reductase large subunit
MDITSDKEDIRIFGSHTILVHSILMFLILSFILMLLSICVMNYLHYTPKFLQEQAVPVEDEASSLHAQQDKVVFALGDEVVFSSDTERPVN